VSAVSKSFFVYAALPSSLSLAASGASDARHNIAPKGAARASKAHAGGTHRSRNEGICTHTARVAGPPQPQRRAQLRVAPTQRRPDNTESGGSERMLARSGGAEGRLHYRRDQGGAHERGATYSPHR